MKPTNYKLLSDEPILQAIHDGRQDELEFNNAAKVLANAAIQTEGPITIGVFGKWGTGKTSLMRLMKKIVDDGEEESEKKDIKNENQELENAAIGVWFNAWQYEREEHLIIPLIATIAQAVDKKQKEWEQIRLDSDVKKVGKIVARKVLRGAKKIHAALRSVLYGLSVKGEFGVPGLSKMEISASTKDIIKRYEEITQDALMSRSLYFDSFERLRQIAGGNDPSDNKEEFTMPQIVVFIDDLDRCMPENAVRLLEGIKLILHQQNFSFVLGIYDKIVEDFIRNKYAAKYPVQAASIASNGDDNEVCRRMNEYLKYFDEYLDKIVQVRYHVPGRKPDEMHNYIEALLEEAEMKDVFLKKKNDKGKSIPITKNEKNSLFHLIAEVGQRNPRSIVRKINSLIVRTRIASNTDPDRLLAGLINDVIEDKIHRDRSYNTFYIRISWKLDNEFVKEKFPDLGETYGSILCRSILMMKDVVEEKDEKKEFEFLRNINELKDDSIWLSIIKVIEKDPYLFGILKLPAGLRWLNVKDFRESTKEKSDSAVAHIESSASDSSKVKKEVSYLLDLIKIEEGSVIIGGDNDGDKFSQVYDVVVEPFLIGKYPVTQQLYEMIMEENNSHFKGDQNPVENVSFEDAQIFCERLNQQYPREDGYIYTLPTEAQWVFAARGGNKSQGYKYSGNDHITDVAWYSGNSRGQSHPVGELDPNELGLFDMSGNVWEWCLYDLKSNADKSSLNAILNNGYKEKLQSIVCGGSWYDLDSSCRIGFSKYFWKDSHYDVLGFRLAAVQKESVTNKDQNETAVEKVDGG